MKFLLLLTALYWFFVWGSMADNPLLPFADAVRDEAEAKWWLFLLGGIELLRQTHYLVSEHWAAYHQFWTRKVFGGFNRRSDRMSDWTRYRLARTVKLVVFLVVLAIVLGTIFDTSPVLAIFELPRRIVGALPFVFQLRSPRSSWSFQFAAIFWFLSRGGVDVYYPDDIKTRFGDVWGQDNVLARVKENMVFLEAPEEIEDRGGYVPGGILLWGPPGASKTLMAEAVAGETGKPYVFVDPGAFINMFMGVGILKVKSLFRKLRRLALRYGGVIVFFDEADSSATGGRCSPPGGGRDGDAESVRSRPLVSRLVVPLQRVGEPDPAGRHAVDARAARHPAQHFFMGGMGGGGAAAAWARCKRCSPSCPG